MPHYIGLDLGTSELKALLLRDDHTVVATVGAPLTVHRPQPLWSEQHPGDWWAACESVMQRLAREHADAMADVAAIGLSGQMHGAVLLDAQGDVQRPAILWNDGRSGTQCERLNQRVLTLPLVTGNLAMPGFTAPKLVWVREHEPEVFAQHRRACCCPRTGCGSNSPATRSATCPTPSARCGWTWRGASGRRRCSTPPA